MTKRLQSVPELPAWFNLKNYYFAYQLDSLGWYEQLYVRGLCLQAPKMKLDSTKLAAALQAIRKMPKIDLLDDRDLSECFPLGTVLSLLRKQNDVESLLGVRSVAANDPVLSYYQDKETINVQLALPDSFLIESFKQYLVARRQKIKSVIQHPFNKSHFRAWAKMGILPYFDLQLWAEESSKQIPNRIHAFALFPMGDKGEEAIRKTTKPLLTEALSETTLFQLGAQAAFELSYKAVMNAG